MATTSIDPCRHRAVLFDMDGVLTDTAKVHAAAWARLFDLYLADRPPPAREDHRSFTDADYLRHVDGKPRVNGVLDFLCSRGIDLPRGAPDDEAGIETGHGLGKLKDRYFREALATGGVEVFDDAVTLIESLRRHHIHTAVISASRNCALVLEQAGIADLFDIRVDGVLAEELGLPGKPDPAVFLEAARQLDTPPSAGVVVEDAQSGVHAARAGGFALVVGVARTGPPGRLLDAGADAVVSTLTDVAVAESAERRLSEVPDGLEHWDEIADRLRGHRPVLLLDFDGTLAPIRNDPAKVTMPVRTREVLQRLARHCPVAIISGRDLHDVRRRVRLDGLWYAGSHGFELAGPGDESIAQDAAESALPDLDEAERLLTIELDPIAGVLVDRKRFALAVHYRNVRPDDVDHVIWTVRRIGDWLPALRIAHGRRVVELLPNIDWNKGRALRWLLDKTGLAATDVTPVFAGDDYTDEDALHEIHDDGIGIVVRSAEHGDRLTWAHYSVEDPRSLSALLTRIASAVDAS
ncbi:trehalose-phosphatase [Saccharopolyspora phatthalungensis]|uniref:Trehalose 6-phosphate phosphatase n=1 Tax=Saccharopolyspora phatthalungensis TaxID=664693 RepID=A0A840QCP6_9PSEU|nr:trehalose-phosphatase [Saccharopolyspora phatthalungensis]MBB5157560.1 trehalose-phosphatase [Saccharopolyspora phatthalungensis]